MSIQLIYSILKPARFAELVCLTETVEKNRLACRQAAISSFINSIQQTFEAFQKNKTLISDRDWKLFDRSFSAILQSQNTQSPLYELVDKVETLAGRRFLKMDEPFTPVRVVDRDEKVSIVSKKSLDSEVFRSMLSIPFTESLERKIVLHNLPSHLCAIFVSVLKNRPENIPLHNMLDLFYVSWAYGHAGLFNETLSQLLKIIESQNFPQDDPEIKKVICLLCSLFGMKNDSRTSESRVHAHEPSGLQWLLSFIWPSEKPVANDTQQKTIEGYFKGTFDSFFSQMKPKDKATQSRLFELLCLFGDLFQKGVCVDKDVFVALKLYRCCEKFNSAHGQERLGDCYMKGLGIVKNDALAFHYYKMAADRGICYSQFQIGTCYDKGKGVPQNETEAARYYKLAADQGHAEAQYYVATCYDIGYGVPKDQLEAIKYYKLAASQGEATAMYNLGCSYHSGAGVAKDIKQALEYYHRAADLGEIAAKTTLGVCYQKGDGVLKDLVKAVEYFKSAANHGDARAQFKLGACHEYGRGVLKDINLAVAFYTRAANQGYAEAQCRLASCYDFGDGVEQDSFEAARLYKLAADQGQTYAQYNLGCCYRDGEGVQRDYQQAFKYFQLAASQGASDARNELGWCYEHGQGVDQNMQLAITYYQQAAEGGNAVAKANLARLTKNQESKEK